MLKTKKNECRRIWFVVLFMALNLIEWLKATQAGDIWKVAVNAAGLVVMALVMSAYPVKELCCGFSKVYTVICLAVMVGIYGYWWMSPGKFIVWQYLTAIMNVWLIGIMLWVLWRRAAAGRLKKPKWDILGILWVVLTIVMVFSKSGRVWPIWFFLIYGIFYLTEYSEEDKTFLVEGMVNGTILSFFIMQIYAYGFRPYDEVRYKGPLSNCNMTALYYLIVYCMILAKLHFLTLQKAGKMKKLFWMVMGGGLLGFQFMTLCRTAWLSAIAVTFAYGILIMKGIWKDSLGKVMGKAVLMGAITLAVFPVVFGTVRWLPTILHHPIWYEGEWSEEKVHSFDPADSEKYVTLEEFLDTALGRFLQILQAPGEVDNLVQQSEEQIHSESADAQEALEGSGLSQSDSEQDASGDSFVSGEGDGEQNADEDSTDDLFMPDGYDRESEGAIGDEVPILDYSKDWTSSEIRVAIFRAYWKDLNWRGHSEKEGYYLITPKYRCWHAQNLWLQIAYYYGIGAGILLVVLTAFMIYYYISRCYKGKLDRKYGVLPLMFVILYFTFGLMEVVWNPGQMVFVLIFLVQHPGLFRKDTGLDG